MSPEAGAKDDIELTFELKRMIAAPYLSGVDALDVTWVRLQKILRTIPILRIIQSGKRITPAQDIALQRLRDEG